METLQKAKNWPKLSRVLRVFTFRRVAPGQWNKKLFHFPLSFYFLPKEIDALPVLLYNYEVSNVTQKKNHGLSLLLTPVQYYFKKKKKLKMVPR